jgi:hypothetical protein
MTSSKANIVIATPCYGGLMSHIYVNSLLKLMGSARKYGFSLGLFTAAHDSLITRARNALVKSFLDATAATHLFFVDADIGFEPEAVNRLVEFDEEVVAGMYPVKVVDWSKMSAAVGPGMTADALRESGLHFVGTPCAGADREERGGFVTGKYAGTGFMMIKRSAIERLVAAYPETQYRAMQTFPAPVQEGRSFYNLFDCMIEPETGMYLSEDVTFCHRFRKLGGKVWLDTESQLRHVGAMEFHGHPVVEKLGVEKLGADTIADQASLGAAEDEPAAAE